MQNFSCSTSNTWGKELESVALASHCEESLLGFKQDIDVAGFAF